MRRGWMVLLCCALVGSLGAEGLHWKAVLATGWLTGEGHSLPNWENARESIQQLLLDRGLAADDIRVLSADPRKAGHDALGSKVERTSLAHLRRALADSAPGEGEGLIVFLTSHGARDGGWLLEHDGVGSGTMLTPQELAEDLVPAGDRPVVVLISSCYAGQFLGKDGPQGDQRVVLVAARRDRSSFGCGVGNFMPEWDETLGRLWRLAAAGSSWTDLAAQVGTDIDHKEARTPGLKHSLPEAVVGPGVEFGLP